MYLKILFRQSFHKWSMTLMLSALIMMLVTLFVYVRNTDRYVNRSMQIIMKSMGLNQMLIPADENPVEVYLCSDRQQLFAESDAVAMSKETGRRRRLKLLQIDAALKRLDEGEFGFCQDCGEAIAPARLEIDPTVLLCISCAEQKEL